MAVHITLREAGLPFDLEKVDLATHKTADGGDYMGVNPKGYVPALRLDDGQVLTEVAAILQYVADRKPGAGLAPGSGTLEHYRLLEWLNFIAAEVHKQLGVFFNPRLPAEWKDNQLQLLARRFDYLAERLGARPFLMGERFTVADAYLFTILGWTRLFKIDLGKWPAIQQYLGRIAARPAVKETLKAEGLAK
jgi:glutathione S-transferase